MRSSFVNRKDELQGLEEWWVSVESWIALVYGRRRVGKTALLVCFAEGRRTVFHAAARRPAADELRILSETAVRAIDTGLRDLGARPYRDWDDALEHLATAAAREPLLLVLDEFPELLETWPDLASLLRAFHDRTRGRTQLRLLLCGSAVRTMREMQEERAPLYGRFDLRLVVHPFRPWEASEMLPELDPADLALVWGIVGGVPLYIEWWDPDAPPRENLARLVCTPGGRLLMEGEYVLAAETGEGELAERTLHAVARGPLDSRRSATRSDRTRPGRWTASSRPGSWRRSFPSRRTPYGREGRSTGSATTILTLGDATPDSGQAAEPRARIGRASVEVRLNGDP